MNADLADDLDDKPSAFSPGGIKPINSVKPPKKPPIDSKIRQAQQKASQNTQAFNSLRKSQDDNVDSIRKATQISKDYMSKISVVEAKRAEILKQLDKNISMSEARNNVKKIMNTDLDVANVSPKGQVKK